MEVTQAMTKNTPDAKAPDLPRFGMVMDLPYSMDKSQWYRTTVTASSLSASANIPITF